MLSVWASLKCCCLVKINKNWYVAANPQMLLANYHLKFKTEQNVFVRH